MHADAGPAAAAARLLPPRSPGRTLRGPALLRLLLRRPVRITVVALLLAAAWMGLRDEPATELPLPPPAPGMPRACALSRARSARAAADPAAYAERSALHDKIGAAFTAAPGGGTSRSGGTQGMSVSDLFSFTPAGLPQPRLRRLEVPVRALVVRVPPPVARLLFRAAAAALLPALGPTRVWLQEEAALHSSLFHASHHMAAVGADAGAVAAEASAAAAVFAATCPLRVVLDRVAVTPGGVVIACWNVVGGGQPAALRARLRAALPAAPEHQLVGDAVILHSTLARLLDWGAHKGGVAAAAEVLSAELCGLEALFDTAWYVEEFDALALALRGAYAEREMRLSCPAGG